MMKNIKDINERNFLRIRKIFRPVISRRKTAAVQKKSYFDKGGIVLWMYWWNAYPVIAHGIATECGAL